MKLHQRLLAMWVAVAVLAISFPHIGVDAATPVPQPLTPYQNSILADSPAVFYPLNDVSTGVLRDMTGGKLNGTYPTPRNVLPDNNIVPADGNSNSALFPGGPWIQGGFAKGPAGVNISYALQPRQYVTIELEFKTAYPGPSTLASYGDTLHAPYEPYSLQIANDNRLMFAVTVKGIHSLVFSQLPIVAGQLYHVAAVYNGVQMLLYINGNLDNSATLSGNLYHYDNTYGLGIGGRYGDNSQNLYHGNIENVAIYGKALTPTQVLSHYNKMLAVYSIPTPIPVPSTVGSPIPTASPTASPSPIPTAPPPTSSPIPTTAPTPSPVPTATPVSYVNQILALNPLAFYRLNDAGSTAADSSGQTWASAIAASIGSGVTKSVASIVPNDTTGAAMTFPGAATASAASAVRIPRNANIEPNTGTVLFWVKVPSGNVSDSRIIDYGESGTESWKLDISDASVTGYADFNFRFSDGVGQQHTYDIGNYSPINTLLQVAITYPGGGVSPRVQINTTNYNSLTSFEGVAYGSAIYYDHYVGGGIGGYADDVAQPNAHVTLQDVAIFGTPLTPTQISALYTAGSTSGPTPAPSPTPSPTPSPSPTPTPIGGTVYQQAVLADGPVLFYPLNDAPSLGVVQDLSGYSHTGNFGAGAYPNNNFVASTGIVNHDTNKAVRDPGGVWLANNVAWGPPNLTALQFPSITTEIWTSTFASSPGTALTSFGQNANPPYQSYSLSLDATNHFVFSVAVQNGTASAQKQVVSTTAQAATGAVYHVVGTYDGTNLKIWVNGTNEATLAASGTINYSASPLYTIGGYEQNYNGQNNYAGTLENAAVYGAALSSTRIAAHFSAGSGFTPLPTAPPTASPTPSPAPSSSPTPIPSGSPGALAYMNTYIHSYNIQFNNGHDINAVGKYVKIASGVQNNNAVRAAGVHPNEYFDSNMICDTNNVNTCSQRPQLGTLNLANDFLQCNSGGPVHLTYSGNDGVYLTDLGSSNVATQFNNKIAIDESATGPLDYVWDDNTMIVEDEYSNNWRCGGSAPITDSNFNGSTALAGGPRGRQYHFADGTPYTPAAFISRGRTSHANISRPVIAEGSCNGQGDDVPENTGIRTDPSYSVTGGLFDGPNVAGLICEAFAQGFSDGESGNTGSGKQVDPFWSSDENTALYYTTHTHRMFIEWPYFGHLCGDADGSSSEHYYASHYACGLEQRGYEEASSLLTFDATYTFRFFTGYISPGPSGIALEPEGLLVAYNPRVSLQWDNGDRISKLQIGGVYVREFTNCYWAGAPIGNCAAIVNPNPSNSYGMPPLAGSYSRTMQITGYGLFNGQNGTPNFGDDVNGTTFNGSVPGSIPPLGWVILAQ